MKPNLSRTRPEIPEKIFRKTCRSCRYYDKTFAWCEYYKRDVPVILDDSCVVWSSVTDEF